MQYSGWTNDVNLQPSCKTNRFVYVNKSTTFTNIPIDHQKLMRNTILINPNFKTSVHINPNFTRPTGIKPSVYINPSVFKTNHNCTLAQLRSGGLQNTASAVSISQPEPQQTSISTFKNRVNAPVIKVLKTPKLILSTPTKIIRQTTGLKMEKMNMSSGVTGTISVQKQRIVKSKYKIVKSNFNNNLKSSLQHKLQTKFKIDNRIIVRDSKSKRYSFKKKNVNNVPQKRKGISYVNIGNTVYKASRMKLQRSSVTEHKKLKRKQITSSKLNINKIINKDGVRYGVNINRRALKRISDNGLRNSTIKRSPTQKKKMLLSMLLAKNDYSNKILKRKSSVSIPPSSNKLKKCNVPCTFYRKFGRCRGQLRGTCNKVHDPAQIIICPRFLQGACITKTCLLSHNVSKEKMPTCKFFLEGMCSREDCPYLHVKVNPKAEICQDFLKGYCKQAQECEKRHQYLCPQYEKDGKCSKKNCHYPHGNLVRSFIHKNQKLIVKQLTEPKRKDGVAEMCKAQTLDISNNCNARYYKEILNFEDQKESEFDIKRPQLDKLPCFIPLADCSNKPCC